MFGAELGPVDLERNEFMKLANISNSFLPQDMQNGYWELLRTRHEALFQ